MANIEDILVPDIGDFHGVAVIEILVKPGDRIQAEQSLVTLESDKATMEIPAPRGGVVREIKLKIGDTLNAGDLILTLEGDGADAPGSDLAAEPAPAPAPELEPALAPKAPAPAPVAASPKPAPQPPPEPVAATGGEPVPVRLPDVGDYHDIPVVEVLVAPGDRVTAEQSVLTLESDKATMEIPVPQAGTVVEVLVKVGDKLNRDDLLLTLVPEGAAAPFAAQAAAQAPKAAPATAAPTPAAPPAATPAPVAAATAPNPAPNPVSGPQASREPIPVHLPDVGDFHDIPVIEVLVAPGDRVEVEQTFLTLESDKATMEIPVPQAGVVWEVTVKVGDKLNRGDVLLTLIPDQAVTAEDPAHPPGLIEAPLTVPAPKDAAGLSAERRPGEKERARAPIVPRPADMAAIATGRTPHASPAVRRFARELGVDLHQVKGSGPKGRILKGDVQGFVKQALSQGGAPAAASPFALPPAPVVDFAQFGPVETVALSRIKRLSGAHLHRCWLGIPHVTQFDEADITELDAFRQAQKDAASAQGVKLTFLPLLLKAVAHALGLMPTLKASLAPDGESLVLKGYTHIGVAVNTDNGLVVPVVRDVDKKGIYQLARELAELSAKARSGKLLPGDMQGGCFSVSSLGGIGGTAFTPIVNAPEVAILGVSRSSLKPVWDGQQFAPRLMLPLSLSYDHRVVDGAEAARFTNLLGGLLGDIRRVLL